jgi:AbrB family looped-hinge helix DNA binding protein
MTAKARITSKGQVTIPKTVRERLGLRTGDAVEFIEDTAGIRIRRHIPEGVFDQYRGYLKHLKGKDVDELIREMRGDDLRD